MKKKSLKGQTVVITGASSGIGKATALLFAKEGANLVLASRSDQLLSLMEIYLHQTMTEHLFMEASLKEKPLFLLT